MFDFSQFDWRKDLVYPLVLLALPILVSGLVIGEALTLTFPVAVIAGWVFRPRHVWLVWLAAIVMLWVIYGFFTIFDMFPGEDDSTGEETVWSFAIESFIFFAMLVLLPIWLGRAGRNLLERRQQRQSV